MMILLTSWILSAALILAGHIVTALIIDQRLHLGTWTKLGLTIFMLLGPLGLLLELALLIWVRHDIRRQRLLEQGTCYRPLDRRDSTIISLHTRNYA